MIKITNLAYKYILNLCNINKNNNLKITIDFKSFNVDFKIYFCDLNDVNKNDIKINYNKFIIYINNDSLKHLYNSKIDIIENNFNQKLILNTKNKFFKKIKNNSLLIDKIKFIVNRDINPILLKHGGKINIIEVTNDFFIKIKFYGGCNGCSFSKKTLKNIVKKKISHFFPEINGIKDITNHKHDNNSYI